MIAGISTSADNTVRSALMLGRKVLRSSLAEMKHTTRLLGHPARVSWIPDPRGLGAILYKFKHDLTVTNGIFFSSSMSYRQSLESRYGLDQCLYRSTDLSACSRPSQNDGKHYSTYQIVREDGPPYKVFATQSWATSRSRPINTPDERLPSSLTLGALLHLQPQEIWFRTGHC